MNINKMFILLICMICFFQKAYCPYAKPEQQIIDQLTSLKGGLLQLKDLLQESVPELPVQKKIRDFFTTLNINEIPAGLIYELYTRSNIIPSRSQEELNVQGLNSAEKQEYRLKLRDFSDLIQEIDQSPDQSNLLTFLRNQLETLLMQVNTQEVGQKHQKLWTKVQELINRIADARYPYEIYRKILESLRELPILPEREEPLDLSDSDKQYEKGLLRQQAAIIKSIQKKSDKEQARKKYIEQLKAGRAAIKEEEERPLPPLPSEPEEEERPLPPLPAGELPEQPSQEPEMPEKEEQPQEGTIPPPPPKLEGKEQAAEKEEVRKSFEEQLKEAAEKLKETEQNEPEEKGKKESEWEDLLKKAMEDRRSSIEPEEEEEPSEEQAEWEYNPWE